MKSILRRGFAELYCRPYKKLNIYQLSCRYYSNSTTAFSSKYTKQNNDTPAAEIISPKIDPVSKLPQLSFYTGSPEFHEAYAFMDDIYRYLIGRYAKLLNIDSQLHTGRVITSIPLRDADINFWAEYAESNENSIKSSLASENWKDLPGFSAAIGVPLKPIQYYTLFAKCRAIDFIVNQVQKSVDQSQANGKELSKPLVTLAHPTLKEFLQNFKNDTNLDAPLLMDQKAKNPFKYSVTKVYGEEVPIIALSPTILTLVQQSIENIQLMDKVILSIGYRKCATAQVYLFPLDRNAIQGEGGNKLEGPASTIYLLRSREVDKHSDLFMEHSSKQKLISVQSYFPRFKDILSVYEPFAVTTLALAKNLPQETTFLNDQVLSKDLPSDSTVYKEQSDQDSGSTETNKDPSSVSNISFSDLSSSVPFESTYSSFVAVARVFGGGMTGQSQALRLGIARAMAAYYQQQKKISSLSNNPADRELQKNTQFSNAGKSFSVQYSSIVLNALFASDLLLRDTRVVERKKPGKKKARKGFTWVKR